MTEIEEKVLQVAAEMDPQNTNKEVVLASFQALMAACVAAGITSINHLAYVLATAHHESCLGNWMEEFASGEDYEGRRDLGNTQSGDGVRFKGRGFVQLTGRTNYQAYSDILGLDLVGNPNLAKDRTIAAKITAHGMKTGRYTGVSLSDYQKADGSYDFVNARRIINGTDRAEKIAAQARRYAQALQGFNTTPSTQPVATPAPQPIAAPAAAAPKSANLTPMSYKIVIPHGSATVRQGPGRGFGAITQLSADLNKTYQVDGETHGEAVVTDDVWVHVPEAGGFVTRTAIKVVY